MFTITNTTSTPITITIPHIETQTILYDDDKLPDLTQMGTEQKGPSDTYVDISDDEPTFLDDEVIVSTNDNRDISDDEPTFLDDEVIVSTNDNRDIFMLHEEPGPIIKFCPLNSASREECGPLVHIQKCGIIPYTNVGKHLIEEPTNVYRVVEMVIVTSDVFHMHCQEKKTTMIQFEMFCVITYNGSLVG